jgi:hypothetical protein
MRDATPVVGGKELRVGGGLVEGRAAVLVVV